MNIRPVLMAAVDDRNGRSYKRTNDRQLFPKRYIATDQSEDANCQEGDGRKERKPRYHDNPFDSPVNSPPPPPWAYLSTRRQTPIGTRTLATCKPGLIEHERPCHRRRVCRLVLFQFDLNKFTNSQIKSKRSNPIE